MRPFIFPVRQLRNQGLRLGVIAYNRGPRRGSNWRGLEFSLLPFRSGTRFFWIGPLTRGFLLSEWKGADGPLFSFKDGLIKMRDALIRLLEPPIGALGFE